MSEQPAPEKPTVSIRTMEIIVALLFIAVALIVMTDSWRAGAKWGDSGPESGFFPFYIGLIMLVASSITLLGQISIRGAIAKNFVDRDGFWHVMQVLIPTMVFVGSIGWLGIYLAAAIYLAFFMTWIGGYAVYKSVLSGIVMGLFCFWLFELTFKVPLPKGPLEAALGF